jgi:hypothetical protein
MRLFRKFVALAVYGALLFPGTDSFRLNAWVRAVSVASTAFDSTLRRKRSQIESERLSRDLKLLGMDADLGEQTLS